MGLKGKHHSPIGDTLGPKVLHSLSIHDRVVRGDPCGIPLDSVLVIYGPPRLLDEAFGAGPALKTLPAKGAVSETSEDMYVLPDNQLSGQRHTL